MGHGVGYRKIDAAQRQPPPVPLSGGIDPKFFAGFSYLLGDPRTDQRSTWGEDLVAARKLISKLVLALPGQPDWSTALQPGVALGDNPVIPSGYTYLLQFIAHDMVQTSVPFWAAVDLGVDSQNCRESALVLDALYGGGPTACPSAFETTGSPDENRYLLRLGRTATDGGSPLLQGACPFRDLARANVAKGFWNTGGDSLNFGTAYQVNVADARNDDSVILTQLTVLFILAHNAIASSVQSARPESRFAYARAAMLMIYHAIIRCDLLPRLLHPDIWRAIKDRPAESRDWLWRHPGLPLEFSHGAFRVGHAMVRGAYTLNDILFEPPGVGGIVTHNQPPTGGSWRTPLEPSWILRWSYFFDLTRVPNYSLRIGPSRSSLDLTSLFRTAIPSAPDGTSFRDYLSAAAAKMWNVPALIRSISEQSPGLIPPGWPFFHKAWRESTIATWFQRHNSNGILQPDDIAHLSCDPPLPLFVLLEAGLDQDPRLQGRCMGVLGSIIVAEVLGKRLAAERARLERLQIAANGALPPDLWKQLRTIDSMPALVNFVADFGGMRGCANPPFI